MQTEDRYDDLTALFEAQDDALQSEAFVERVMQPVRKRTRWRTPLLFGAGGIGIGAALSQIGGLFDLLRARSPDLTITFKGLPEAHMNVEFQSLWVIGATLIILSCAAIVVSERA